MSESNQNQWETEIAKCEDDILEAEKHLMALRSKKASMTWKSQQKNPILLDPSLKKGDEVFLEDPSELRKLKRVAWDGILCGSLLMAVSLVAIGAALQSDMSYWLIILIGVTGGVISGLAIKEGLDQWRQKNRLNRFFKNRINQTQWKETLKGSLLKRKRVVADHEETQIRPTDESS